MNAVGNSGTLWQQTRETYRSWTPRQLVPPGIATAIAAVVIAVAIGLTEAIGAIVFAVFALGLAWKRRSQHKTLG